MITRNFLSATVLGALVAGLAFASGCSSDDNAAPSNPGDETGGKPSTGGKSGTGGSKNDAGDGGGSSTGGKTEPDASTGGTPSTGGTENDGGGGDASTGGTPGDSGVCTDNAAKHCIEGCDPPSPTLEQILNLCNGISSCTPFDNSKLTKLGTNGELPPLP